MGEAAFKLELRLAAMEQIIRMLLVDKFAREGLTVGEAKKTGYSDLSVEIGCPCDNPISD